MLISALDTYYVVVSYYLRCFTCGTNIYSFTFIAVTLEVFMIETSNVIHIDI